MYAPVVIFGFNRPHLFSQMAESLMNNKDFDRHQVFVYIDGPRNDSDLPEIKKTIREARKLTGNVIVRDKNMGLANSIISGVTEIINSFGCAIVIEDDLILHPHFLNFMDNALSVFKSDKRILSISGHGLKIKKPKGYTEDIYLSRRASSWGWATWADRWNQVDWSASQFDRVAEDSRLRREFNQAGSDMFSMLRDYIQGKNNSWAIRFCFHQFINNLYSVHPFKSLVNNIGFDGNASNCRQKYNRFKIDLLPLHQTIEISEPEKLSLNPKIASRLRRFHAIPLRIYSRIRRIFNI